MIRKARIEDIAQVHSLINKFARLDLMLPRSLNELYENLRDFWVAEENGRIVGCAALHISWDDLAEIKSLAVATRRQGRGIGRELVLACINEAKELGAGKVFVLTYKPDYFKKFGFRRIEQAQLPHKIWAECINCCKFPDCNEVALLKNLKKVKKGTFLNLNNKY
ncbi:MAG: N-acetyltransferase [Candidatus Omnitrophica bacterium]|nr:N-acetyltransferase [Candidatus Omnitrophota bacterium]